MTKAGNSLPPEEMGRVEDMTGTPRRHAEEVAKAVMAKYGELEGAGG